MKVARYMDVLHRYAIISTKSMCLYYIYAQLVYMRYLPYVCILYTACLMHPWRWTSLSDNIEHELQKV